MLDSAISRSTQISAIIGMILVGVYFSAFLNLVDSQQNFSVAIVSCITVFLTGATFTSSFIMAFIVTLKDDTWFGNLSDLRINLALGCTIATLVSIWGIIEIFRKTL